MIFLMSFLRMRRYSYFIKYSAATSCFQIIQLFSVPVTWKFGVLLRMYVGNLFCYNSSESDQSEKSYFSMTSLTSKSFSEEKKCRPSKPYCRNLGSLVPAVCTVTKKIWLASKDHKDTERARLMNIFNKTPFNNEQ